MISTIIIYLLLWLISLFPIIIWGYVFSYIDDNPLNKKRFYIGLIWWVLSVFPILYMDKILNFINLKYLNIFYYISQISNIITSLEFALSLFLFFLVIVTISLFFGWFIHFFKNIFKVYLKNILVFFIFIIILSFIVYLLNLWLLIFDFSIPSENSISFWNIIFNSFKLVIFYYILVAFIEETSKHFNFLQSSVLQIKSIKSWVLFAIFVALWFSLVENVLYLYSYYIEYWLSAWLLKIYFLRSIFSVIVHILCSSVVAYYFSKAILLYREDLFSLPYLKIFSFWIWVSLLLHLIFDVALTLWFSIVMFIYFIWGYLYVSSIFYRE